MSNPVRCQLRLLSEFHPALLRRLHARAGAFNDQGSLKPCQHPNHLPHGAACRCLGIDGLGEGLEPDALAPEFVQPGKASGKDVQRPALEDLRAFVRDGDTEIVHSTDRLARNLDDLRRIVQSMTKRGIRIEFVKEGLVFTGEDSPMANLMLSVVGAFAEFERALIRERQRKGIALARQRRAYRGRKKSLSPEQVAELRRRRRKTDKPRSRIRHRPRDPLPIYKA